MASLNKFHEQITRDCLKKFQLIGRGAFGTIYRARHEDWRIDVAVKILSRDTYCTREELLNEARAMNEARFLYVLRLLGLYVDDVEPDAPKLGLVMEFMENGSLSDLQYKVPSVPWALRLRILHQVALGMNFLHSLSPPLLHLDLKPSNVLLDGELHVRVADFGLSKFKRGTTQSAILNSKEGDGHAGTLEFMPPESFSDLNYKPTLGSDVYSYAILMWTLLTGKDPYSSQRPSTEELEKKVEVLKLDEMIGLMKQCWHNDVAQRPTFRECSQETEEAYSCYKQQIVAAVRKVQDVLMKMDSSLSEQARATAGLRAANTWPSCPTSNRFQSHPSSTASFGTERNFKLQFQESSYSPNEAVPLGPEIKANQERKPFPYYHRSISMEARKGAQEQANESLASEVKLRSNSRNKERRPYSDTFTMPTPYSLGYMPHPPSLYPPYPGNPRFPNWDHSHPSYFSHPAVPGAGAVHIVAQDIRGMQIGSSCHMVVETDPGRKPTKKE